MQRGVPSFPPTGLTFRCLELNVRPSCALASRASAPCGRGGRGQLLILAPFQSVSWT